jgi:predicted regulator of Ras-like GTPase activity (Roadblock/LC7/MglB family)
MSDVILYKEDIDRLNSILQDLVAETKILSVLLVNKDTRLLASHGTLAMFDMSALAALIVGCFASTQAIAGLIGEKEFRTMSHSGKSRNLVISLVDDDTICAAVSDRRIPLAAISSSIARHIKELGVALQEIRQNMDSVYHDPAAVPSLSPDDVEKGFDSFFEGSSNREQVRGSQFEGVKKDVAEAGKQMQPERHDPYKRAFVQEIASSTGKKQPESAVRPATLTVSPTGENGDAEADAISGRNKAIPPIPDNSMNQQSNTENLYFNSLKFLKTKAGEGTTFSAKHTRNKWIFSALINRREHL